VVCGVNLPMLLDFVFHRELPLDELVERVVERGRSAIRTAPGRR
jgi:mannose/fructose-specific phosphotransferase system component IIA